MTRRLTPILLVALAFFGATATDVGAGDVPPVPVLAETISSPDPAIVPAGMIVVFLPPAGDGFSEATSPRASSRPVPASPATSSGAWAWFPKD